NLHGLSRRDNARTQAPNDSSIALDRNRRPCRRLWSWLASQISRGDSPEECAWDRTCADRECSKSNAGADPEFQSRDTTQETRCRMESARFPFATSPVRSNEL